MQLLKCILWCSLHAQRCLGEIDAASPMQLRVYGMTGTEAAAYGGTRIKSRPKSTRGPVSTAPYVVSVRAVFLCTRDGMRGSDAARGAGPKHNRKNLRAMLASFDTVFPRPQTPGPKTPIDTGREILDPGP
eukprot:684924-Rhodomonas_salina.2